MRHQPTPTLPKGTRDFEPIQVYRRRYIIATLQHIYRKYGFVPLETPSLENLTTLMGKYGEEGDQLIFKVLNSGDFLAGIDKEDAVNYKALLRQIATKGLRYDLTVPLMRYVAMHAHELVFPFRRYQIQPVWRADRPQQGRYREFYQCDVDIVGTSSLLCEAEILVMVHEVLQQLGVQHFTIHINHRIILEELAVLVGAAGQEQTLSMALDKLDKVGAEGVREVLQNHGFTSNTLDQLLFLFELPDAQEARWGLLSERLGSSQRGLKAIQQVLQYTRDLGLKHPAITLDPTLARGLSYYTGTILEVKIQDATVGSIGGGGRYDRLTDVFGLPGMTGVGFSFGLERLYTMLEAQGLFPTHLGTTTQIMLANIEEASLGWSLEILAALRTHGICAELYPETIKLKRQLQYAHKRSIPWVAVIGTQEQEARTVTLKNMQEGTQQLYTLQALLEVLS